MQELKEILKDIEFFRYKYHITEFLQDCFSMFAIAISNRFDIANYKEREEEYLKTINKYSKEEQDKICSILGKIILLYGGEKSQYNDFLGSLFMLCNSFSKEFGQFFTPYSVSKLMAKLVVKNYDLTKEVVVVNDCCCGGGGLLIACVEELERQGVPKERILVVGQDIDRRCVNMSYIQLSLLGIPAVILKGDTISYKFNDIWRTPAYYLNFNKFEQALGNACKIGVKGVA